MGTIVCQNCNSTIEHFEDEKVSVLYSHSRSCLFCESTTTEEEK